MNNYSSLPTLERLDHLDGGDTCDLMGNPISASAFTPSIRPSPQADPSAVTADAITRGPIDAPTESATPTVNTIDVRRTTILKALCTTRPVQAKVSPVVAMVDPWKSRIQANRVKIDPKGTAIKVRAFISQSDNLDEIGEGHAWLSELESDSAAFVAQRVGTILRCEMTPIRQACVELIDTALATLAQMETDAITDESALFERWGLEREKTGVTKRFTAVRNELATMRSGLLEYRAETRTHPPHGGEFDSILNFFHSA